MVGGRGPPTICSGCPNELYFLEISRIFVIIHYLCFFECLFVFSINFSRFRKQPHDA